MEGEKLFIYKGGKFPDPGINPEKYKPEFFQAAMDLESEVFYELRKQNNILPYRINESSETELANIKTFFNMNKDTFCFLFDNDILIGNILYLNNYIQSLSIAVKRQKQGYGTRLSTFAINKILDSGYDSVVLNTMPGNIKAENLYRKIGFIEVKK